MSVYNDLCTVHAWVAFAVPKEVGTQVVLNVCSVQHRCFPQSISIILTACTS